MQQSREDERLQSSAKRIEDWRRWGTYLPERQWGVVREDYSCDGNPWASFTHEMAQYRAYRWGEDGLLGWTDRQCRLCFSTSLWNGRDECLKERLFGLTNPEGNHGEDVKELYYYLDATPTHSYAKALYKYPQAAFPYEELRRVNAERTLSDLEYELLDTGIFEENRYFDVLVEYAKRTPEDTLIRLTLSNRGPDAADLTVLPTLMFRNTWSWDGPGGSSVTRPLISQTGPSRVCASHPELGEYTFHSVGDAWCEELLFTENESNSSRLAGTTEASGPSKDGFQQFVVQGNKEYLRDDGRGTKTGFVYRMCLAAGESKVLRLRLHQSSDGKDSFEESEFDDLFDLRSQEADAFYALRLTDEVERTERSVARQAYAGLLWSKQFYHFIAKRWLQGDSVAAPRCDKREKRQEGWGHLFCRDVLSVPDKWEYPWFAAWDTAFHMVPMGEVDPEYAKEQLLLLLREWYMHPNGQMPAYEFAFSDVNPPVHAWAVWHVYRITVPPDGKGDLLFLERAFQKLLLNFTWWVNRKDENGQNLFGGGFLGLDNIGVFDRSEKLPDGSCLNQADGTAWMGLYCSCMLQMALELAHGRSEAYEDIATKFFEHYIAIIDAINNSEGHGLWSEDEGFYFDSLRIAGQPSKPLAVKSLVGIVPIFAVCILKKGTVQSLKGFNKRVDWFLKHRPELSQYVQTAATENEEVDGSYWISITPKERLARILRRVFDESQFYSPFGVRALSQEHRDKPFEVDLEGKHLVVRYVPAEGDSDMFGGNSNWRGPIWAPANALIISALERYYLVFGESFRVEYPTGSQNFVSLIEAAELLSERICRLFKPGEQGCRPCHGDQPQYANDPFWRDLLLFSEYFSGDDGRGVGAAHQTGWTALIATLIRTRHMRRDVRNRAQ